MAGIEKKRFDTTNDVRSFEQNTGQLRVIDLNGPSVGLATFEPGWQWSQHVKPIAGTASCMAPHAGYLISGRMQVRMDDGTELTLETGDVVSIEPGHDAWVLGDQPCVMLDWQGYADYAKPGASTTQR